MYQKLILKKAQNVGAVENDKAADTASPFGVARGKRINGLAMAQGLAWPACGAGFEPRRVAPVHEPVPASPEFAIFLIADYATGTRARARFCLKFSA
jgi:hypothetical protein